MFTQIIAWNVKSIVHTADLPLLLVHIPASSLPTVRLDPAA